MNDLITRLAEQADAYAKSEYDKWIPTPDFSGIPHIRSIFNEKFAELIIRECINIAYEYDKPKLSGPGLAIASNIESHFDIYIEEDGRFVK